MVKYDVVIIGGGLAGLTLAMQSKLADQGLSILVLEKRAEKAPEATHKVGESIVELGSYYLRDVLQLKSYLTEHQLPKLGFRFFFSPEHSDNIAKRVEVGTKTNDPIPAHQIDRGSFENELTGRLKKMGVEMVMGARVEEVELSKTGHKIHFERENEGYSCEGRWVIDSTGRRGFLKRKLGLERELDHDINAAWFRIGSEIDIDDWSEDKAWSTCLGPGRRRLATNHLMGEGYWVWIIPLVSGNTSIGIVADPSFHAFDKFNTFEKAMEWLEKYEPVAARMLDIHRDKVLDFKVMKHFAHDIKQIYSADRWAVTGEAGVFLDPFYSPGTDFIALSNTWLTELIIRDTRGEDISLRTMIYEHAHRQLFEGWLLLYKNMYSLFGKTQIMLMKIVWDWGSYWAIPTLMFRNNGYTNTTVLKRYASTSNSIGQRFARLNQQMQQLFLDWSKHEVAPCSCQHINVFDLDCLLRFHKELAAKYDPEELILKVESNLKTLEQIAAEIFRLVSTQLHDTPADMKVDPYTMSISDGRDELLAKSKGKDALDVDESIKADLANVWLLNSINTISEEHAW